MAKCDVSVRLEEEREFYHPGDIIRGSVEVRIDDAVKCNALTVGLRWRTHGKGNVASETAVSQVLFEGEWQAGAVFQRPFELQFPAGPFTSHGHYLNVVWEVYATVDIPWAIDPRTEHEVVLQADPQATPDWNASVGSPLHLPSEIRRKISGEPAQAKKAGCGGTTGNILGIGCLLLFLGPMLFFLAIGIQRGVAFSRGEISFAEAIPWMLAAVVILGLFLAGSFKVVRNMIARKRLGMVTLGVEPETVRAGGDIHVSLGCRPDKATDLISATARIVATEIIVRGSGTNKRTYRHVAYEKDVEITGARALPPNLPFHGSVAIPIPQDAPPSFYASHNKLVWTVEARLDIARWPDWADQREFLVHP